MFLELSIMVTGGKETNSQTSVEILHGNGSYLCTVSDLPLHTFSHAQSNGIPLVCGGAINGTSGTCQSFESGDWTTAPRLHSNRTGAVSWKTPPTRNGPTIIMGGTENPTTAEILVDGQSIPFTNILSFPIERLENKPLQLQGMSPTPPPTIGFNASQAPQSSPKLSSALVSFVYIY